MKQKINKKIAVKKFFAVQVKYDDEWRVLVERKGRVELNDFFAVFLTEKAAEQYVYDELHMSGGLYDDLKENEWRVVQCFIDIKE